MQKNHDSDIYWLVTFLYCFLPTFLFNIFLTYEFSAGDVFSSFVKILALQFFGVPAYIAITTIIIDEVRSKTRPANVPKKGHWFKILLLILLSLVTSFFFAGLIGTTLGAYSNDKAFKQSLERSKEQETRPPYIMNGSVFIR